MELFICFFVCLLLVMYLLGITGVSVGVLGRINIIFGVIKYLSRSIGRSYWIYVGGFIILEYFIIVFGL